MQSGVSGGADAPPNANAIQSDGSASCPFAAKGNEAFPFKISAGPSRRQRGGRRFEIGRHQKAKEKPLLTAKQD